MRRHIASPSFAHVGVGVGAGSGFHVQVFVAVQGTGAPLRVMMVAWLFEISAQKLFPEDGAQIRAPLVHGVGGGEVEGGSNIVQLREWVRVGDEEVGEALNWGHEREWLKVRDGDGARDWGFVGAGTKFDCLSEVIVENVVRDDTVGEKEGARLIDEDV